MGVGFIDPTGPAPPLDEPPLVVPQIVPPLVRHVTPSLVPGGMPDAVVPGDLVAGVVPASYQKYPLIPDAVSNPVGPVPGLPSTNPAAPPAPAPAAAPVELAAPPAADPAAPVVPATAHTPAFRGPATGTTADLGQAEKDIARASAEQQQATVDAGAALREAADAEAEARGQMVEHDNLAIERHRETQRQIAQDVQRVNDQQRAVLEQARTTTIPDFWEGRQGAEVAGAVMMALGEAGRAMTAFGTGVNVGNTAKDIIDSNIRTYYQRKKEEVDNLYRYADKIGQLGQQEKADYAQKLVNLQYEIAATHQSAADHVLEIAAQSKGRVAQAQALELAKQQQMQGIAAINQARENQANLQLKKRQLGIEGYQAETARMRAIDDRRNQLQIKIDERAVYDANGQLLTHAPTPTRARDFAKASQATAEALKVLQELGANYQDKGIAVNPLGDALRERKALQGRLTLAVKTIGELGALSGPDMGLVNDIVGGKINTIVGDQVGLKNVENMLRTAQANQLAGIGVKPTADNVGRMMPGVRPAASAAAGSDADQAKAWVAAHPGDPRVAKIKAKYGF